MRRQPRLLDGTASALAHGFSGGGETMTQHVLFKDSPSHESRALSRWADRSGLSRVELVLRGTLVGTVSSAITWRGRVWVATPSGHLRPQ